MKRMNIFILAVLLILIPAGFIAAQQTQQDDQTSQGDLAQPPGAGTDGPVIEVADQSVLENSVFVNYVVSEGPGWVVIHKSNDDGSPGEVIGHAHVADGENENVEVQLEGDPEGALIAMLHTDAEPVGTYDFPGADVPARQIDTIVMASFEAYPQDQLGAEESDQQSQDGTPQDEAQQQEQPKQ